MKHCRNCENCILDPLNFYIKGIDYFQCATDGHYIAEPFWEKCDKYKKSVGKKVTCSSWLYHLVELINAKKKS